MNFNLDNWDKIKTLFNKAIELSPEERDAFLDESCKDEPELKKEIESLIESFGRSESFLETPALQNGELGTEENSPDYFVGMKIGKYRVENKIGEGGMAVVYSAVRIDEQFKRRVAIKFIKRGMDTEEIIKRFKIEEQTLAGLNHPYIAKIIDGGTTEKGLPYFVMELIEGEPIDKYCKSKNLTIPERLELFQKVCSAIQYAHQNLVVHRDIKPGNIFVTKDGIPKLLDFGIAKLLDPTDSQTKLTQTGLKLMTLEYASPEQFQGKKITTATDIYSLGVVLYELLTGRYPYKFNNSMPFEIERVICTTEPEKPSTAVSRTIEKNDGDNDKSDVGKLISTERKSQEKFRRRLAGDIDNIVLKAMQKEPERRYSSVEQLSEDISRHLKGLPIIARKNSLSYRSKKFYERHHAGVIAAVISLLIIIAGITGIIIQSKVAANERDRAILEAKKSERINAFLQEILAAPNPEVDGKDVKVVDVLKNASEKINRELSGDPEIKAAALFTIGTTYMGLGLYNKAEKYLKSSLDISKKIYSANDPQIAKVIEQLGVNYQQKGNFKKADSLYRKALKIYKLKGGKISSNEAKALSDYGSSLNYQGKYNEAKKYQTEALDAYRKIYGNSNPHVLKSLDDLETIAGNTGDWKTAAKYGKKVLDFFLKTDGKESVNYSKALSNYASILEVQGNLDKAIEDQREAVEIKKKVEGKNHPDAMFAQITLADELTKRGGDYVEAANLSKEAMESLDKSLPHINVLTAYSRVVYAKALIKLKDFKKALPLINDALQIRKKLYSPNNWLLTTTKVILGACLVGLKQYSKAEQILKYCYSKLNKNDEGVKYYRILTLQNLVKSYKATGNKKVEQKYVADLAKENN